MGSRPVFQYELNGNYVTKHESISDAARIMGCNESSIRKVLDKGKNSCGFKWYSKKLVDGYNTPFELFRKDLNKVAPILPKEKCPLDLQSLGCAIPEKYLEHPEMIENLIKYGTEYNPKDVAFNSGHGVLKDKVIENSPDPKHVKILLIDIETAPVKALVWKMWKENIGVDQVLSDWFCLTWAAKWLGESEVFSNKLTSEEVLIEDDKRIIKEMWKLFDDADIVIGHNSKNFDVVKLNTRFVIHGLVPPSPYKQVDTLEVARKEFGFSSNKLQHLANSFGIEGKYDTSFNLWKKCLEGDGESLYYMEHYNKHDVEILELVYLKLRPYIKGHPNLDMYFNDPTPHCPICGKHNLILVPDKNFYTQAVEYQLYRCEDCGGLSRAKRGNKILNKKVISAIPR